MNEKMDTKADQEAAATPDEKLPKTRTRSPAYPAVALSVALQRANAIWTFEKKNPATAAVLASHWDLNPKSSLVLLTVSALIKYGLLEEVEGMGSERMLKLTDTALHIILNEDEASPERTALIKQCALTPKIHAQLWTQFNGELPSDANLRRQLIVTGGFNASAVDGFIKDFRDTIAFAKLSPSDKIEIPKSEEKEEDEAGVPLLRTKRVQASLKEATAPGTLIGDFLNPPPAASVLREFNFPLAVGVATLRVPVPLAEEDFESLVKMLITFKDGLVKKPEPVSLECAEGWKAKAKALAELGVEFNLTNFDYTFDIATVKQLASDTGFDLRLDLNKRIALFRRRPQKPSQ